MLLLNPSWAQRPITLGRQASRRPRCHLALQWQRASSPHGHWVSPCGKSLLGREQHSDHAGQGQHTASTPGPPAAGKRWSDVQITAQARWFSGKSCRIWLRGPAEKLVLLLNPPTQQQRALCTAEHNRQGPTTLLPLKLQGETPSKAFKIRDLI